MANTTNSVAYARIRALKGFYDLFRGTHPGDPRFDATFLTRWFNVSSGTTAYAVSDSVYTYPHIPYMKESKRRVDSVGTIPYEKCADPCNPNVAEVEEFEK